jgi:hypothetical protein
MDESIYIVKFKNQSQFAKIFYDLSIYFYYLIKYNRINSFLKSFFQLQDFLLDVFLYG